MRYKMIPKRFEKRKQFGKTGHLNYIMGVMLLSRYILRAHAGPFAFSLVTLMFIFLLQFVMKFIDQLVGKGLTPWVIIELVALNLAWMLVLAVPMSVLVATLMAFGDLSSRNEITAMKAGGVSIYRMMMPVLLAGIIVCAVMIWFNNHVLPESNHRSEGAYHRHPQKEAYDSPCRRSVLTRHSRLQHAGQESFACRQ